MIGKLFMIEEFMLRDRSPFAAWFNSLDAVAAAKVVVALTRLEAGNFSNVKSVGGGVMEYKIDFGPAYRVYFGKDGDRLIILLCGGAKKTQSKDIDRAKQYWREYKKRKKEGE
jgi:putative addiction module killer protein